jgi:hypothetical protein
VIYFEENTTELCVIGLASVDINNRMRTETFTMGEELPVCTREKG